MSRSCSVQLVLEDPEAKVKSIKPSGDCFYEAIAAAFSSVNEDVRDFEKVFVEDDDTQAMALRRFIVWHTAAPNAQNFSKANGYKINMMIFQDCCNGCQ